MKKFISIILITFLLSPVIIYAAETVRTMVSTPLAPLVVYPQDIRGNSASLKSTFLTTTSVTASSTFANGINLTKGCFALNGTCTGNIVGPVSSTNNAFARFNGTTGKLIQNSGFTGSADGTTLTFANGFYIAATGVIADFIPYISNDASNFSFVPNGIGGFSMSANTIVGINPGLIGGPGSGRSLTADAGSGTNVVGGNLILSSGAAAGNASSTVLIQAAGGGASGSGASTPSTIATFDKATTTFSSTQLVVSSTATSSFAKGINLTAGCFAIGNTCVGGGSGSGTVNSGTTGQFPYYAGAGTTLTATSTLFVSTGSAVGIGTSTPEDKLDVKGEVRVLPITAFAPTNSGKGVVFRYNTVSGADTGEFISYSWDASAYKPFTIDSSALGLNPLGGNVCVGATSCSYKLSANNAIGSTGASAGFILHNRATDAVSNTLYSPTAGNFRIYSNAASADRFQVDSTGKAFVYAGLNVAALAAFATGDSAVCQKVSTGEITVDSGISSCIVSSRIVKHNIESLVASTSLSRLLKLNPVSFAYNGTNKDDLGLIAEDVASIDARYAQYNGKTGKAQAINWSGITADLIKVVENMWTRLTDHESRIQNLEKQNAELLKRIEKLENK